MSNLTKMELLQHRHLSLLRALQDADVEVVCDEKGKWVVTDKRRPCTPEGGKWVVTDKRLPRSYTVTLDSNGNVVGSIPKCQASDVFLTGNGMFTGNDMFVPKWQQPCIPEGYKWVDKIDCGQTFADFLTQGWTVELLKKYGFLVPIYSDKPGTSVCIDYKGHLVGWDGERLVRVPLDSGLRKLLHELLDVIFATAPAKA